MSKLVSVKPDKSPDEWEIKNWADTLMTAEEIKNDPEKMKLVGPLLDKKIKAIKSISDIRKRARQLDSEKPSDELEYED